MKALLAVLVAAVLTLAWLLGGLGGWIYLLVFLLAAAPGLPIGFALFGRRHAAGWTCGLTVGYALTALVVWLPVQLGIHAAWAPVVAWALLSIATWTSPRPAAPLVPIAAWQTRDTAALLAALLIVPVLVGPAFARLGERDADGAERYRAYFTADFLWHVALTAELAKASSPPRNPYLARRPLHYYWTYFNVPALAIRLGGVAGDVKTHLALNALGAGLLFIATIFVTAWAVVPRAGPVLLGVTLAVLGASAEGAFAVGRLLARGQPLAALKELNIDAITSWWFQTLTIDSLPRSLWYTPQHAMACSLSLIALAIVARGGATVRVAASLGAGLALGLAVIFSPFLGGTFAIVYGIAAAWNALRSGRQAVGVLLRYALAALPVVLALAWCMASGTFEGAGGAVAIGLSPRAMAAPVALLALALGPILVTSAAGLLAGRRTYSLQGVAAALAIALFMLYFVTLTKEPIWIGWRAGQVFLVTAPAAIAALFAALHDARRRGLAMAIAAAALIAGLPTTAVDAWNAQDVGNTAMGAGFRWTVVVPPDTLAATDWIRGHTASDAIVQMSIAPRGRETWTLIPTFAERRMAAGEPISLLAAPEYDERSAEADAIYRAATPADAWRLAHALRVDYVYLDRVEREAFGPAVSNAFDDGRYFEPAFSCGAAAVYRVR